ncbi:Bug family tripartite tricarboxylate transporter substrate binding protein [Hoeflea ulvae]|uniref:Tripartite tricarboxylate transporter substrate binding protein n=1 Tax=Hoeflea ulvae TaxID=2983764 RepID=A0ABT3YCK8_9HYPH|nr:tripartite tricarboxylate transporter substrate binding protein [Hoeflea ulvae]MCY0093422.1 tripartite tricarboxylate transporter substrate binding protein [Hoeflea ulvae]
MTLNSNLNRRRFIQSTAAGVAVLSTPSILYAQGYPSGPVTIVCGFSPGGTTDALARMVANYMSQKFGQPFVVENITGAAGTIGMTSVANAEPDGQTLLFTAVGQIAVSPHTFPGLTVDPVNGLEHISMLAEGDFVLTVNPEVPVQNIAEFIALAKEKPNSMFYGTAGAGGNLHLFLEAFLLAADVKLKGVHYSGGSALMPDVLNNQVQLALSSYPVAGPQIEAGNLRPLLIIGKQRNANLPDVPTAAEAGLPELSTLNDWFGLHAPAGTPDSIIQALAEGMKEAAETDEIKARLQSGALRTAASTPEEFRARIEKDFEYYGRVAKEANVIVQ